MQCFGKGVDKTFTCSIELLDDTTVSFELHIDSKGEELVSLIVNHLNLLEKDYFGLRFISSQKNTHWLDQSKKVWDQLKSKRSQPQFYFGVKFYAADPCKLKEEITRYQFFLQAKRDVLQGRIPLPFDLAVELCALAVQSELGDHDIESHGGPEVHVSSLVLLPSQSEDHERAIAKAHRSLRGFVPAVAEYQYLDKIKQQEMYGVDLHPVKGDSNEEYFIGLTPVGVVVYKGRTRVGTYYWPRILNISFNKLEFQLKVKDKDNEPTTYVFGLTTKQACKHLWKCCIEYHIFYRLLENQPEKKNKMFSLRSRFRYSGRTESEAKSDILPRPQPQVRRLSSRRQDRRTAAEVTSPRRLSSDVPLSPEYNGTLKTPYEKRNSHADESPRAVNQRSLKKGSNRVPPTSEDLVTWSSFSQRGLFTSGRESPKSVRSEIIKFPGRFVHHDSFGEAENLYKRRFTGKDSDNDSTYSSVSHRRRHRRNRYCGSEGDASSRRRNNHYKYVVNRHGDNDSLTLSNGSAAHTDAASMVSEFIQNDAFEKSSAYSGGSVHAFSLASYPVRRHQSSRKADHRQHSKKRVALPEEVGRYVQYGLISTHGMQEEQLKDLDMNYTEVRTRGHTYSPADDQISRKNPSSAKGRYGMPNGSAGSHVHEVTDCGSEISDMDKSTRMVNGSFITSFGKQEVSDDHYPIKGGNGDRQGLYFRGQNHSATMDESHHDGYEQKNNHTALKHMKSNTSQYKEAPKSNTSQYKGAPKSRTVLASQEQYDYVNGDNVYYNLLPRNVQAFHPNNHKLAATTKFQGSTKQHGSWKQNGTRGYHRNSQVTEAEVDGLVLRKLQGQGNSHTSSEAFTNLDIIEQTTLLNAINSTFAPGGASDPMRKMPSNNTDNVFANGFEHSELGVSV